MGRRNEDHDPFPESTVRKSLLCQRLHNVENET